MARWLALALRVLTLWTLLLSTGADSGRSSPAQLAPSLSDSNKTAFVRVILLGATGNLAAKYLWVASFRLALQAYEQPPSPQFEFVAAATNTQVYGEQWKTRFFNATFLQRVCGDNSSNDSDGRRSQCIAFFHERFLPSVQYAQLQREAHYKQLAKSLKQHDADEASSSRVETGRLVYLAIPPTFFAQVGTEMRPPRALSYGAHNLYSSELAHRYLRPRSSPSTRPFFRVVIEKPFGTDLKSAQALQLQLRQSLKDDENFLIDHFAGKAAVQALSEFFEDNHEQLHSKWGSKHIFKIKVRMAETETCEGRIQFFHSTGIIRDVMANHLQLLLGIAVAPSFSESNPSHADGERLAFAQSLFTGAQGRSELVLGQYEDYVQHFKQETGQDLLRLSTDIEPSSPAPIFVPTAALVGLQSSAVSWNGTQFELSAAKAAHERRLELVFHFKTAAATGEQDHRQDSCELRVTIQTSKTAERRASERIEWTCAFLDGLVPPSGWEREDEGEGDNQGSHRVMVPVSSPHEEIWQLGDQRSAYDVLLREAATSGDRKHFASMQEAVAVWELWTPIVQHAERATLKALTPVAPEDSQAVRPRASYAIYQTGSTPWSPAPITDSAGHAPRDEL